MLQGPLGTTYLPLVLLAILLVLGVRALSRLMQEVEDDDEPESPEDLLWEFKKAHAAGELSEEEFQRVQARLLGMPGGSKPGPRPAKPARKGQQGADSSGVATSIQENPDEELPRSELPGSGDPAEGAPEEPQQPAASSEVPETAVPSPESPLAGEQLDQRSSMPEPVRLDAVDEPERFPALREPTEETPPPPGSPAGPGDGP